MFFFRKKPTHKIYTSSDAIYPDDTIKRSKDFVYVKEDLQENIIIEKSDSDTSIIDEPAILKIKSTKYIIIINPHNFNIIIDKSIDINNCNYKFIITNKTKILPIFDYAIIIVKSVNEYLEKKYFSKNSYVIFTDSNYFGLFNSSNIIPIHNNLNLHNNIGDIIYKLSKINNNK